MAANLGAFFRRGSLPLVSRRMDAHRIRNSVTEATGAIKNKPEKFYSFGIVRVCIVSTPFLYGGAMLAKYFASFLETSGYFVPDDDD